MDKPDDPKTPKPSGGDSQPSLSTRLRGRMESNDEPEEKSSNTANILALVMLVAIVVLGGLFYMSMQKSKAAAKAKATADAKAAAEQARADSIAKAEQDSLFAARADSIAKVTPKKKPGAPATEAGASAATAGAAAAAEPPPPPSKFGIDVGTFLNQERAAAEQTKLQGSTGLSARVMPVSEGGVTSYRVVLGEFTSKAEAQKKANDLIVSQAIREAHVIKLKAGG